MRSAEDLQKKYLAHSKDEELKKYEAALMKLWTTKTKEIIAEGIN